MIHPIADCEHPLLCLLGPELLKSFLMSSTIIMRYVFKSGSVFSGVLGYPGLAKVGVLGSDDGEWSWFLLVRFLFLLSPSGNLWS